MTADSGGDGSEGFSPEGPTRFGKVVRALGSVLHAEVPTVTVGELCRVYRDKRDYLMAEVVGFVGSRAILAPFGGIEGLPQDARVEPLNDVARVPPGKYLLGRAVNALCEPLDGGDAIRVPESQKVPVLSAPPSVLERAPVVEPVATGIRAIDGLLTLGWGQRIGLLASAGDGKSTLMGALARNVTGNVQPGSDTSQEPPYVVVALIGERGREVREFWQETLSEETKARAVAVISTSDEAAILRLRGAFAATAIAASLRDEGKRVVLLMDSLTRYARAARDLGLDSGEIPGRQGYPSSLFSLLPALLERCCNGPESSGGRMLGIYTVLYSGEESDDVVAQEAKSILDGHILLSQEVPYYPKISVRDSISRVASQVLADKDHSRSAERFRRLYRIWPVVREEFVAGMTDESGDAQAAKRLFYSTTKEPAPGDAFLQQDLARERTPFAETAAKLKSLTPAR